jgi:hypothetical protein
VALVPPAVLTLTSTAPDPAGDTAVTDVGEFTFTPVAAAVPNLTVVALLKFVPLIVTVLPPAVGPVFGLTPVTVGGGAYLNSSAPLVVLVPPDVPTVTWTVPDPAGATAVIDVSEATLMLVASAEPNLTAVASPRLVPVIVTVVPPASGPSPGATFVKVGSGT